MRKTADAFQRRRNLLSLAQLNFLSLRAAAFFVALWPAAAIVSLLIGGGLWLLRLKVDPDLHFRRLPFDRLVLLFAAISGLSVFVSPDRAFSFYNYYNLVGLYVVAYFLTGQLVRDEEQLRRIMEALALGAVLVVLYGFYQCFVGIDTSQMKWVDGEAFPELTKRIFSTWENPNILAGYLNEVICFVFAFFMAGKDRLPRFFLGVSLLALVACLLMTYARGAFLSLAVVIGGYGLLRDRRVLFACVGLGLAALFAEPLLAERLLSAFTAADTSSEMRLALWESTVEMIFDHPVMGIGWGAYWLVYPQYDFYINDPAVKIVHAHNMYLNFAAEIGLFGAITYFWIFFGTFWMALRKGGGTAFLRAFRLGAGLALLSVALGGLTDDVVFNMPTSILLWMLFALTAASVMMQPGKAGTIDLEEEAPQKEREEKKGL
ncbi:MAG: O-antigen ligase family protein [Schwartzia sp. (in: firmicutes)]